MSSRLAGNLLGRAFSALACVLACIALAHAADGPGVFESLGKLLKPADAPAAGSRAVAVAPASEGRRIALVIGNGNYQHADSLPKLANPANDAEDIATALRGFGFEVIERKNQTLEEMSDTIAEFGSRIGGSEAAMFYFAGHGIQVNNQNYLMPVNARIASEASVPYQGINVNQILDEMDKARSAANIVMLDACRNNPISGKFRSGKSRGLASPGSVPRGTVIVYATDPGNTAADGDGRNGLFTSGLLTAFKGKELSLDDVLTVASAEVERGSGNTQTPYVNGPQTLKKNFHFRVTVDPGRGEIEKTFWTSIERSTDPADFEAYLRKYPNGSYRALAENQIRRLKAGQQAAPAPAAATRPAPAAVPPAPTPAAAGADPETQFWNEVKASGAREYFDAYLKQYPKGRYLALARFELKKLDDKEKAERARQEAERKAAAAREEAEKNAAIEREHQEAQRAEQDAWERAKAAGTVAAYAEYLGAYPKGRYAALAQAAQQKAQREAAEREKQEAATRRQDEERQKLAAERERLEAERATKEMRPGKVLKDCADCPEMVMIPAGSFQMGETGSSHRVTLKGFAIGKTEVTQGQWQAVMGGNPSNFKQCGSECPVEQVSWDDAKEFIRKLNVKTGKTYRLPSEAEWEYACRAGARHAYCGSDTIEAVAWYGAYATPVGNSGKTTNPVARKQANAWGLYDMSGDVWEWTEDCWNGSYNGAPSDGSAWTTGECSVGRVLRGGSWGGSPRSARSAIRGGVDASRRLRRFPSCQDASVA